MFRLQKWVKDFFSISHAQANGIMVLLPLVILIMLSEPAWHWYMSNQAVDFSSDRATLDSMIAHWNITDSSLNINQRKQTGAPKLIPTRLTLFNPNATDAKSLADLGFKPWLASRIVGYRSKGGKFKVKSDLLKIYGMDTAFYHQVYKFIDLPEKLINPKQHFEAGKPYFKGKPAVSISSFDLNLADTSQLKQIFGIGEKLSMRIIKYRDALGGFTTFGQVGEVYGLDSAVVNRLSKKSFINGDFLPTKINVNTATEEILASHPYFSRSDAKSIVAYRFQHGEFRSIDDLRGLPQIKAETLLRIAPYVCVSDN